MAVIRGQWVERAGLTCSSPVVTSEVGWTGSGDGQELEDYDGRTDGRPLSPPVMVDAPPASGWSVVGMQYYAAVRERYRCAWLLEHVICSTSTAHASREHALWACVPVGDGSPSSASRDHVPSHGLQCVGKAHSRWEVTVPLKASFFFPQEAFKGTVTGLGLGIEQPQVARAGTANPNVSGGWVDEAGKGAGVASNLDDNAGGPRESGWTNELRLVRRRSWSCSPVYGQMPVSEAAMERKLGPTCTGLPCGIPLPLSLWLKEPALETSTFAGDGH